MTVEEARKAAKAMLAVVARGGDPAVEHKAERAAETVAERWLAGHVKAKRKGSTEAYYRALLDTHVLPAIGTKQAIKVAADIAAKLGELAEATLPAKNGLEAAVAGFALRSVRVWRAATSDRVDRSPRRRATAVDRAGPPSKGDSPARRWIDRRG